MNIKQIENILNRKFEQYNHIDFISNDPIGIPHRFILKQDIEIAGFFAAILAWGNRKSIINSCHKLIELMNHKPYEFILEYNQQKFDKILPNDKTPIHRTFNVYDLKQCLKFLAQHYRENNEPSLETAFTKWMLAEDESVENALNGFYHYFFAGKVERTQKHIAAPFKKSACKRLNIFLRWMVRKDEKRVDFGIWQEIKTSQLIIPLDVHVRNVAEKLGLLNNIKNSWESAVELTKTLKQFDKNDPVKYDYALFSLGVAEKY